MKFNKVLILLMFLSTTTFLTSCGEDEETTVVAQATEETTDAVEEADEVSEVVESESSDEDNTDFVDTSSGSSSSSSSTSSDGDDEEDEIEFGLDTSDQQRYYSSFSSKSSDIYSAGSSSIDMHDCTDKYENGVIRSIYLKANSGNDEKLDGAYIFCRDIDEENGGLGDDYTKISGFGDSSGGGGTEVDVEAEKYPVGVRIYYKDNNMVDIRLMEVYGTYLYSTSFHTIVDETALSGGPYTQDKQCDPNYVLSGINFEIKESTGDSYKVYKVILECTKLNL